MNFVKLDCLQTECNKDNIVI